MENIFKFATSYNDLARNFENAKNASQSALNSRSDLLFWVFVFVGIVGIVAVLTVVITAITGLKEAKNKRLAETIKAEGVSEAAKIEALATLMKARAEVAGFDERNKNMIQNDVLRSVMSKLTPEQKVELMKEIQSGARSHGQEALEKFDSQLMDDEKLNSIIDDLMSSTGFDENSYSITE